jgi:hypothetical protein
MCWQRLFHHLTIRFSVLSIASISGPMRIHPNEPLVISWTTFDALDALTSLTTTLAPSLPNKSAYARPRPEPAPVTMTTLPAKSTFSP